MMLSVITINYNNKLGLKKTLESVVGQSFDNFEYIVIDGDSKDGSKEVIEDFKKGITYWVSEPDSGIYNAMNKGIRASKGDYLLFLNSGDVFYNRNILSEASKRMSNGVDIYYGDLVYELNGKQYFERFPKELSFSFFYKKSLPHPATFIKRDLFDKVFYYNEGWKIVSDWEFFVCAICKYNVSYKHLDLILSDFEIGGISCDPMYKEILRKERALSLKNNFPLFINDADAQIKYKKILNSDRFLMLQDLEKTKAGKRMGSLLLRFITIFFKR
jgi:glycosyltransferase involved in cell wall biosynthesis